MEYLIIIAFLIIGLSHSAARHRSCDAQTAHGAPVNYQAESWIEKPAPVEAVNEESANSAGELRALPLKWEKGEWERITTSLAYEKFIISAFVSLRCALRYEHIESELRHLPDFSHAALNQALIHLAHTKTVDEIKLADGTWYRPTDEAWRFWGVIV